MPSLLLGLTHLDEIREETIIFKEPYSKYGDEKIRSFDKEGH